jgi:hypothetical protein
MVGAVSGAFVRSIHADQLLALEQLEALAWYSALRQPECSGVFATARAVAVIRAPKRPRDAKADAAAKTTAVDRFHGSKARRLRHRWHAVIRVAGFAR